MRIFQGFIFALSVVFTFSLSFSCGYQEGINSFSFHTLKEEELNTLERKWLRPKRFRTQKSPVFFYEGETLWYCYTLKNPSAEAPYLLSLSKKSLGWLEVDLRSQSIALGKNRLIGKFRNLSLGKYLIRIFHKNNLVNKIEFDILPNKEKKTIDYDTLVLTD